jgi:hypothetical protein
MPVYHFTLHAYRSWSPDNPRGFLQKNRKGIQPPNRALAHAYNNAANFDPILFTPDRQHLLLWGTYDVCSNRDWRLHSFASDHAHPRGRQLDDRRPLPGRPRKDQEHPQPAPDPLRKRTPPVVRRRREPEAGARTGSLGPPAQRIPPLASRAALARRRRATHATPFKAKPPTPVGGCCFAQIKAISLIE